MRRTATFWVLVLGAISAILQFVPTPLAVLLTFAALLLHLNVLHIVALLAAIAFDAVTGRLPRAWLALPPLAIAAYAGVFALYRAQSQAAVEEVAAVLAARNTLAPFAFDPDQHALVMYPTYLRAVLGEFVIPEIFVRTPHGLLRQTLRPLASCQVPALGAPYDPLADRIDLDNPLLKPFCIHSELVAVLDRAEVEVMQADANARIAGHDVTFRTYTITLDGARVTQASDARLRTMADNPLPLIGCAPNDDTPTMSCEIGWRTEYRYIPEMRWESQMVGRLLGLAPRTATELEALTTR